MISYVALYRGDTLADSQLVAVSNAPSIVRRAAEDLLANQSPDSDPISAAVIKGKRQALELISGECAAVSTREDRRDG